MSKYTFRTNAKPFIPMQMPVPVSVPSAPINVQIPSGYMSNERIAQCKSRLRNDCWSSHENRKNYLMYLNDFYIDNLENNPYLTSKSNLHGSIFNKNLKTIHTTLEKPTAIKGNYDKCHYGFSKKTDVSPRFWCSEPTAMSRLSDEDKTLLKNSFESLKRRLGLSYSMGSKKKSNKKSIARKPKKSIARKNK